MFYVSEILKDKPKEYKTELEKEVYEVLEKLEIPFERVDTDEAITMEDCALIDEKLNMQTVKTLFLCNRQKTDFYLFITKGDKPFSTKNFSGALSISRVSFASPELLLEMLGTKVGSATVLSALFDKKNRVKIVVDKEVYESEDYGCSDGTTTCYMKLSTADVMGKFLDYAKHKPQIIEV